jgi:argininosuccinate lyase
MMPQKKNPDIFELLRGKTARGGGNVVALLTLVKGLPSGYNRDQQEDRQTLLETAPLVRGALRVTKLSLPHVAFDRARGEQALAEGFTQATDLAEALVRRGVPFREAYKAVGALVRKAVEAGVALSAVPKRERLALHPALDDAALASLDPRAAVAAKESVGGTGPRSVDAQIAALHASARALAERARATPSLQDLARTLGASTLEPSGTP